MGRKSSHKIGDFSGKLEIIEILSNNETGKHVSLKCKCHYCGNYIIINNGNLFKKYISCGCQRRNSEEWKSKGPKIKPWQLKEGESAFNNLFYQYKRGAEIRNLEFDLSKEQFKKLTKEPCFYCGDMETMVKRGQGKTSGDYYYNGIDRVNNDMGYTIENCVASCSLCNFMKHKNSQDIFLNQIRKIYEYKEQEQE